MTSTRPVNHLARALAGAALIFVISQTGHGPRARGEVPDRTHEVTLEDYFSLGLVGAIEASPDGKSALFLQSRWDAELDRRNADIWLVDSDGTRRLTWSDASESGIAWHPNAEGIFFVRPHKEKAQVWTMSLGGGEARPVTAAEEGVGSFRISSDGKTIYYTTREKATSGEWDWFKKKYDKLEYGSGAWKLARLWRQELEGEGKPEKIAEGEFHIWDFSVRPDGKRIAMVTTPDPRLVRLEGWSEVAILNVETKKITEIDDTLWRERAPSPYGWIEGPRWSSDGGALAFTVSWDGYPTEIYVTHIDASSSRNQRLPRPDGAEVAGGSLQWVEGTPDLLFIAQDRTKARVFRSEEIRRSNTEIAAVPLTPWDVHVWSFSTSPSNGSLYYVASDGDRHQDIYSLELVPRGGPTFEGVRLPARIASMDPQVDSWVLPITRVVKWKGWNGDEVEGVLSLPRDYQEKQPLPTIVMIHGGPGSASLSVLNYWMSEPVPLYTAKGWAVFRPNYRGSIGYGDKFHTDLIGHKNDRDVADINAGIDWLVDQGIADPKRLAVNGWSNGGSLTNWLVVSKPDRFKAASSGAGVADFILQFGLEDTPGHVINYSEGFPWERWDGLMKRSPLVQANKVKCPVLFLVGEKDARVPAAHARAFHRSLGYVGVPTELVVFPGEGHGLSKMSHRRAKIELELAWFEKHVLGLDPTPPEEVEDGADGGNTSGG